MLQFYKMHMEVRFMESRTFQIASSVNPRIIIDVIPGHFATNHSHITHYIDLTKTKTLPSAAHLVAAELAKRYPSTNIDTIICMDGMDMVAAYLADELAADSRSINSGKDISVVVPEYNLNSQMIFRDNVQKKIWNCSVLLLVASATTGKTINRAFECIKYYGGTIAGVSAIFSAADMIQSVEINSVFAEENIPGFRTYNFTECPDCAAKRKIDAIVNAYGYSKI